MENRNTDINNQNRQGSRTSQNNIMNELENELRNALRNLILPPAQQPVRQTTQQPARYAQQSTPYPNLQSQQQQYNARTLRETQRHTQVMQIIETVKLLMFDYKECMRDYNSNIYLILQILRGIVNQEPLTNSFQPRQTTPTPAQAQIPAQPPVATPRRTTTTNPSLLRYFIYPFNINTPTMEDVIVRPTEDEIINATRIVEYSEDSPLEFVNTSCPIMLDDFQDGDMLCQIVHCKHAFRERSIYDWFRTSVRCPVCRYDIRTYVPPHRRPSQFTSTSEIREEPDESGSQTQQPNLPTADEMTTTLTNNLANILNDYLNQQPVSGTDNISHFQTYDASGNLLEFTVEEEYFQL